MKKVKEMTRERVKRMVILGFRKLSDPYYQGAAAEIAFYFLLSIVPTLILLSQLLGLFSISLDGIRDWLNTDMIRVEGADMIQSLLDYSPSGVNSVFLAITAVWAASRAQFAMLRITNYTLTDGISTGKGYVRDRIRSLKTVVITVFTIGFSLVILVYGELILKLVFGIVAGSEIAEKTWVMIRWPIAAGLYFLMISYNYYVLPTHRVPYRAVVPGSVFASIGLKTNIDNLDWGLFAFSIGFVAVALIAKIIGCGLTARACRFNWPDSLKIGVGMMTRGEVALIVSQKGLSVGLLSSVYFTSVILLIIVSSIATPIILKLLYAKNATADEIGGKAQ